MIRIEQKDLKHDLQYISFDIKKLVIDSYIPFDIYIKKDNGFVIIINKGTLLNETIYNKLLKQKALYISSANHSIKNFSCKTLEHYVKLNRDLNEKLLELLCKVHKQNYIRLLEQSHDDKTTECIYNIVQSIVYIIQEKQSFIKDTVQYFSDEYILESHSLHVALYAVNLGHLLHLDTEQLVQLGVAGLLHDVGVKTIDEHILQKESDLDLSELHLIQQHPEKSVAITKHNHIHNPYILDAIMHHHERYDGSGYPDGLEEKKITQYASILGICDVFDALTNERPYRKKFTYFEALKFMIKDESMENKFNTHYLQAFLKSLL